MSLRWSALAGVAIFLIWWPVVLVEGATRPGYDATRHAISRLALGPDGWIQTALFVAVGLLHLPFAYALSTGLPSSRFGGIAPALFVVRGACFVLLAIFPTDVEPSTQTTVGTIHQFAAVLGTTVFVFACLAVIPRLRNQWRIYVPYTVLSALLDPALGLLFLTRGGPQAPLAAVGGILQRLQVFVALLWPFVIGLRLARTAPTRRSAALARAVDRSPGG
jgi:hypothetical membrane protein